MTNKAPEGTFALWIYGEPISEVVIFSLNFETQLFFKLVSQLRSKMTTSLT